MCNGKFDLLRETKRTPKKSFQRFNPNWQLFLFYVAAGLLTTRTSLAQTADGNAGISSATTQISSYFDAGTSLMYAIGAIVGLIGAIKVYQKWNHGDHDTGKVAAAWFGSCVFLVIVATVLKSFFGVT